MLCCDFNSKPTMGNYCIRNTILRRACLNCACEHNFSKIVCFSPVYELPKYNSLGRVCRWNYHIKPYPRNPNVWCYDFAGRARSCPAWSSILAPYRDLTFVCQWNNVPFHIFLFTVIAARALLYLCSRLLPHATTIIIMLYYIQCASTN